MDAWIVHKIKITNLKLKLTFGVIHVERVALDLQFIFSLSLFQELTTSDSTSKNPPFS